MSASVTPDEMLWFISDLPVGASIYRGKNYWTVSTQAGRMPYIKVRNRRLSDALAEFMGEYRPQQDNKEGI